MTLSTHRWSRRSRKTWFACLGIVVGTALVTMLVVCVQKARETDLADPTAGITATAKEAGDLVVSPIQFRDVTEAMGIKMRHGPGARSRLLPEDTGSGLAWGDYDGDGDWDLYVVNFPGPMGQTGNPDGANRLFRNDGDGFVDVTNTAGVADVDGFGMGATFADYDDDGDADLYVTNFGPNRLYRNRGDGSFEEVAVEAGVADPAWSTGVAWGDFDRDGHLDLYVCNYVEYEVDELAVNAATQSTFGRHSVPFTLNPNSFDPVPNRLYRNRGDGTFEEVAAALGVSNPSGRSFAATFCDLDGDGWLDLYVTNDVSENKLFRNTLGDASADDSGDKEIPFMVELSATVGSQQDGRSPAFADLSAVTGAADPRGSMGLSVGEIGQMSGTPDGLPDLFITHWVAQENAFYQSEMIPGGFLEYRDKTRQFRLGEVSIDEVGWGCGLADFDLDGRVDLVVANGSTLERTDDASQLISEPLLLFWNNGKHFQNVAPASGKPFEKEYCARGLAVADFDDDGDADVAISINRGEPLLFQNESSNFNRSLKVRLKARPSLCFGAKVEVTIGQRRQIQWWGADVTFLGMHAPEPIFGLGSIDAADRVHVTWADGAKSLFTNVTAGSLEIAYPKDSVPSEASRHRQSGASRVSRT